MRRSAKRFMVEAACSKPPQKNTAPTKRKKITTMRFFSTSSRPPNINWYAKYRTANPAMRKRAAYAACSRLTEV